MKLTFIGAGNMAEAIVAGILDKKVVDPWNVCVADISHERLQLFESRHNVKTLSENAAAVAKADVVVLAVKPQVFPTVWPEIERALESDALVISIMAGIPSAKISAGKSIRVVRVMPNTPSLVGEGASGIAAGEYATGDDLSVASELMGAVGTTVVVKESEIDAVTALSGSGPAYVFYLLEGMLEAAEKMGLNQEISRELALATVIGAARLMQETGEDADALRKKVTSKGGTTEAAVNTLQAHDVKESIVSALLAAQARSRELANG
ncbi:MAG: pyrroline-5-carboxylate reductase [Kiritimatiellales bacterium]|nr:pyrroline-5-carboxylate reductase [Kiritimatiellales bacterium]